MVFRCCNIGIYSNDTDNRSLGNRHSCSDSYSGSSVSNGSCSNNS